MATTSLRRKMLRKDYRSTGPFEEVRLYGRLFCRFGAVPFHYLAFRACMKMPYGIEMKFLQFGSGAAYPLCVVGVGRVEKQTGYSPAVSHLNADGLSLIGELFYLIEFRRAKVALIYSRARAGDPRHEAGVLR